MRKASLFASICFSGFVACSGSALAQESESPWSFELGVASSYLGSDFNAQFSPDPVIQFTGNYDFTEHFYASAYVYSGFDSVFDSTSSEYGGELGFADIPLFGDATGSIATGRYANYAGSGGDIGDWFVRGEVSAWNFTLWHSQLWGETDGSASGLGYTHSFTDSFSVTPSIAYLNLYHGEFNAWNPGISASYAFSDTWRIDAMYVYPEDEEGERDGAFSLGLFASW